LLEIKIRIRNNQSQARVLVLEPWASEVELPIGQIFTLVSEGDPAFPMEFELLDDRVVVYAFDSAGAMLSLFDESGKKLF
jgi:hypothetical protein